MTDIERILDALLTTVLSQYFIGNSVGRKDKRQLAAKVSKADRQTSIVCVTLEVYAADTARSNHRRLGQDFWFSCVL